MSKLQKAASEGSLRPRIVRRTTSLSRLPRARGVADSSVGVSVAFLTEFAARRDATDIAALESQTTRYVASAIQRTSQEKGISGPYVNQLEGQDHIVTGGALIGPSAVHVAHAWDANFSELVVALQKDAEGEFDRRYTIDVFCFDLHSSTDDPASETQDAIAGVPEVLLLLGNDEQALSRLWVLFEALLAMEAGKLRVRCTSPSGFGDSVVDFHRWQASIDAVDWVLAQSTRKADDKRLRGFVDRVWEMPDRGFGIERRLAHFKKFLRQKIYGQILLGAVLKGDLQAVQTLLQNGVDSDQRDAYGNTAEELASFAGRFDIEDALFQQRMQKLNHVQLSAFFATRELLDACASVPLEVLAPFLTETPKEHGLLSSFGPSLEVAPSVEEEQGVVVIPGAALFEEAAIQSKVGIATPVWSVC